MADGSANFPVRHDNPRKPLEVKLSKARYGTNWGRRARLKIELELNYRGVLCACDHYSADIWVLRIRWCWVAVHCKIVYRHFHTARKDCMCLSNISSNSYGLQVYWLIIQFNRRLFQLVCSVIDIVTTAPTNICRILYSPSLNIHRAAALVPYPANAPKPIRRSR